MEWRSGVRFPSGTRLVSGESRDLWHINATVTIPDDAVEGFLRQRRFWDVQRTHDKITAKGPIGFDQVSAVVALDTLPTAPVQFCWRYDEGPAFTYLVT